MLLATSHDAIFSKYRFPAKANSPTYFLSKFEALTYAGNKLYWMFLKVKKFIKILLTMPLPSGVRADDWSIHTLVIFRFVYI